MLPTGQRRQWIKSRRSTRSPVGPREHYPVLCRASPACRARASSRRDPSRCRSSAVFAGATSPPPSLPPPRPPPLRHPSTPEQPSLVGVSPPSAAAVLRLPPPFPSFSALQAEMKKETAAGAGAGAGVAEVHATPQCRRHPAGRRRRVVLLLLLLLPLLPRCLTSR